MSIVGRKSPSTESKNPLRLSGLALSLLLGFLAWSPTMLTGYGESVAAFAYDGGEAITVSAQPPVPEYTYDTLSRGGHHNEEATTFWAGKHAPALGFFAAEDASAGLSFSEPRLASQLAKHGEQFGITGPNNAATREEFLSRLVDHIDSPDTTVIEGTYRGAPAIHYLDPATRLNVFTTPEGGFWGAWQLGQEQLENVLFRGSLQ